MQQTHTHTHTQLDDVSLSQSNIEQDFAEHIQDLAEKFAEEIEDMKTAISDMFGLVEAETGVERFIKDLGGEKSRRELDEETAEVEVDVINAIKKFEVSREELGREL